MLTVSVLSEKGGCGKTTVARHVAACACAAGLERVAVLDMDPQATVSLWGDMRRQAGIGTPLVMSVLARRLRAELQVLRENGCRLAVIDTAGGSGAGMVAAARACDVVLVPCRTWGEDLDALESVLEVMRSQGRDGRIVLNGVETRSPEGPGARRYLEDLGEKLFEAEMGDRVAYPRSYARGLVVSELEPKGKAAAEMERVYAEFAAWTGLPAPAC